LAMPAARREDAGSIDCLVIRNPCCLRSLTWQCLGRALRSCAGFRVRTTNGSASDKGTCAVETFSACVVPMTAMNAPVANHRWRIWQFMFGGSLSLDSAISRGKYGIYQFVCEPFGSHQPCHERPSRSLLTDRRVRGCCRVATLVRTKSTSIPPRGSSRVRACRFRLPTSHGIGR